jgi:hypothetical protein
MAVRDWKVPSSGWQVSSTGWNRASTGWHVAPTVLAEERPMRRTA